jgi:uncharacterized repeat protein (TIGR01451 family)
MKIRYSKFTALFACLLFAGQLMAAVIVDNSPDTTGVPELATNYTNLFGSQYMGDRFTLYQDATITGGAIFSGTGYSVLGAAVRFVILPDEGGVPGAVPVIDETTVLDVVDTTLTTSNPNLDRKHALIPPQILPAGDYWFYMTGVGTSIGTGTGAYDDDILFMGADSNPDLEIGANPGIGDVFFTLEGILPIIGVDIEAGQGSPVNWNSYTLADVDSPMTNLVAEDGSTTSVSFQLDGVTSEYNAAPVDGSVIPAHTPDLTTVCCDLLHGGPNPTVATWSGLVPLATYDYWVFTSSAATDTITVTGDDVDSFASPNVSPDSQRINGILGSSGSTFESYARQITASGTGTITIEILSAGTPTPSGYAIRGIAMAVVDEADLAISKLDTPDPVVAGTELTYTIRVDNIGDAEALDVTVTDNLPSGVTLVSTTGCAEDPAGVPTCSLGTIAPAGFAEYTATVLVDPSTLGTLINTATVVTSSNESIIDNNATTAETAVITEADLSITKMDSSDPFISGGAQMLVYTIEVSNAGPSDATNVIVTDTLSPLVTFQSTSGCLNDPLGVPDCQLGTIPAGGAASYTITVSMNRVDEIISNAVSVNSDASDPTPGNDYVEETTEVFAIAIPTLSLLGLMVLVLLTGGIGWMVIRRF